jgi:exopolyphosphatase/guanosine-5'-triphosphate,3'-diphosphate pyrophosphatase
MRIGVIDLGTNSVRFDIHEWVRPGVLKCFYRKKIMVRLGQEVFKKNLLQPEAMQRAEAAIVQFVREAEKLNVTNIVGAATSAVRDAKNGKAFVQKLKSKTAVDLRIISGKEEARLIMKGIRYFEPLATGLFGFCDIGGGSTEVGVCENQKVFHLDSYALGAARFAQVLDSYPVSPTEIFEIRRRIRKSLGENLGFKEWPKLDYLLGASGTIKALMKIMKALGNGRKIARKELEDLVGGMSRMSLSEIKKIPGMEERRIDLILPGAIVLEEVMDFTGAKKVFRTKYALREGLLQEELERQGLSADRYELQEVKSLWKSSH